jgi:ribonucleoside-diphosphate reductase alpha chain
MTVEGAPHLKDEHLPVFDCANRCGKTGKRFIEPTMAHVHMMAAAQPFLSGAISKTINMPNEATVDEVKQGLPEGWKLGLKAIALYRDGSKLSQPLSSIARSTTRRSDAAARSAAKPPEVPRWPRASPSAPCDRARQRVASPAQEAAAATRRRPSSAATRSTCAPASTRTATLGEIFVDMHKEGAAFRSADELLRDRGLARPAARRAARRVRGRSSRSRASSRRHGGGPRPSRWSTSVIDYVFRELAISYLGRNDLSHVEQADLRPDGVGRGEVQGELPSHGTNAAEAAAAAVSRIASVGYVRSNLYVMNGRTAGNAAIAHEAIAGAALPNGLTDGSAVASAPNAKAAVVSVALGEASSPAGACRRGQAQGLRGGCVSGMRQLHHGPQRDVPEMHDLRRDHRLQLNMRGVAYLRTPGASRLGTL